MGLTMMQEKQWSEETFCHILLWVSEVIQERTELVLFDKPIKCH